MAIYGEGRGIDLTFGLEAKARTTTAQYMCVGQVPGTTSTDYLVGICGASNVIGDPTGTASFFIGVLQSFPSSTCDHGTVRMMGVGKVTCAESISSGSYVMPYFGASTTTRIGQICQIDDGVTNSGATMSITSQITVLGRALESGSTGTVISVFINPQLYDRSLIGTIGIT